MGRGRHVIGWSSVLLVSWGAWLCAGPAAATTSTGEQPSVSPLPKLDLSVPAPDDDVDTWSQTARSGSLSSKGDTTTLKLEDVSDSVVGFSDQPTHLVGRVGAKAFFAAWDSKFGVDAPNAVLASTSRRGTTRSTTLTLGHPDYDAREDSVTFEVIGDDPTPVGSFQHATLTVDDADNTRSGIGSGITLVDDVPVSIAPLAEFHVTQSGLLVARVGVHAGASEYVPTGSNYTVQATTTMGDFTLTSNPVSFTDSSANLVGRMLMEDGYYDFQLVLSPGSQPDALVLENAWRKPIEFSITKPNSPFHVVTVVDELNIGEVSTRETYEVYAIVNGISTEPVTFSDRSATVTLVADPADTFRLVVS
jgi:hypothetical protein